MREPSWRADGDSAPNGADGGRKFHLGLHADPRGVEKCRASRRPVDHCPDLEGGGRAASTRAADLWQTFLRAHWGVIAGADFFTTEVWTWRGLVTYYIVFVIDLASRRVHILGSTPHPHELFMRQIGRTLTSADDGLLRAHRVLICDRDAKWSGEVRRLLGDGSGTPADRVRVRRPLSSRAQSSRAGQ
jgi:hypothetical protein